MLFNQISEDLKTAMKAQDKNKVESLRLVFSKIKDEAIKAGERDNISDDIVLTVLKKRVKQGKDSIEQFKKADRKDLVETEEAQLQIIEKYLPAMMSENDIKKIVIAKKEELGIDDKSKMGLLMGAVMKETAGQADGNVVKGIVMKTF
jgi:uncharacterized protein YqeY